MQIAEPLVTLTDFLLALECLLFAALLVRGSADRLLIRRGFVVFFLALAIAAALGGISHGFILDKQSPAQTLVWNSTLLSLGGAAMAAYALALLLIGRQWWQRLRGLLATLFLVYAFWVVWIDHQFLVAIIFYLPATLFLFVVLIRGYLQRGSGPNGQSGWLYGITGLGLTFVAAGIQQSGLRIGPLDYNTVYHLVQAVGLYLIYLASRQLIQADDGSDSIC